MNCDQDWFFKLYRRYQKPIGEFVRSKISNKETAAEVTQEVFLKIFRFHGSYCDTYAFSTWLWTIARNTVTDYGRAQASAGRPKEYLSSDDLPSRERSPEAVALRKDQFRFFLKAIRSLTRPQRRVIWMRVVHQLSYEEIARRMGVSLTSVKNLALRAKATLKLAAGSDALGLAPALA